MIKNIVLGLSVLLNVLFVTFIVVMVKDKTSVEKTLIGISEHADQERIATADLLARLTVRKISKTDLMSVLTTSYPQDRYFVKPQENGVGFASMFFSFDEKDLLTGVETTSISASK